MRIITLNDEQMIIEVKWVKENYQINSHEIESEVGEIGQIMQEDGTFITPEPVPTESQPYEPTNAVIAQMISDLQIDLVIAGVI